jgi:glycosyltransferase involved in cell wall biosynthesis
VYVAACAAVAAELPQPRFVLIGSGPLEGKVAAQIKRHGLQGPLPPPRHLPARRGGFHELDVFVLSSRFEGCPYRVLEATRAEVPVRRQGLRDQFKRPCG